MRVLVTGGRGMLGTAICEHFVHIGHDVLPQNSMDADITDINAVRSSTMDFAPNLIIHSAAMTNVDGCELDPASAFSINAVGASNVATVSKEIGAKLVYVSTDFVFDGKKGKPYTEDDETNPINVYGLSKLKGEHLIREACPQSYIVRTSWLFGKVGKCFPKTILRVAATKTSLDVVSDQIGCPTFVDDLATVLPSLVATNEYGIYHVSNAGQASWSEFAQEILECAQLRNVKVNPISASEWPSPTQRPTYSVLKSAAFERINIQPLRHWKLALKDFVTAGVS